MSYILEETSSQTCSFGLAGILKSDLFGDLMLIIFTEEEVKCKIKQTS